MLINPLAEKLSRFVDLTGGELKQIEAQSSRPVTKPARAQIIEEGDRPETTCLMLEGRAQCYKSLPDGGTQTVGLQLPRDMCDLHGFLLASADHSVATLGDAVAALIPKADIINGIERQPGLARALWCSTLVDVGVLREWLLNVGQRDGLTRIAHLFCELWIRADQVGLIGNDGLVCPMTQLDLGQATGLTSVHVNRSLKVLRDRQLMSFMRRQVLIPDIVRLAQVAGFNPDYLQLKRRNQPSSRSALPLVQGRAPRIAADRREPGRRVG